MPKFLIKALVTVSAFTEVEAETLADAIEEAHTRDLSGMCHSPFDLEVDEGWHIDNDGVPFNVQEDD